MKTNKILSFKLTEELTMLELIYKFQIENVVNI